MTGLIFSFKAKLVEANLNITLRVINFKLHIDLFSSNELHLRDSDFSFGDWIATHQFLDVWLVVESDGLLELCGNNIWLSLHNHTLFDPRLFRFVHRLRSLNDSMQLVPNHSHAFNNSWVMNHTSWYPVRDFNLERNRVLTRLYFIVFKFFQHSGKLYNVSCFALAQTFVPENLLVTFEKENKVCCWLGCQLVNKDFPLDNITSVSN